ncbi:MAG TPA: NUDIX hydrolase [Candidatus Nanopelagicales bacterium]|jgi:hypothetical protein|nr:NUDIX hydrolase [Candidatus Nanopelagicales bacterium]
MSINLLTDVLLVALLLGVIAVYLSSTAGRLDRVHHRIETAAAALDAQLLRRAALSVELAESGLLDPAAALLLDDAARRAAAADPASSAERSGAESDLTRVLERLFPEPADVDELLTTGEPDDAVLVTELAASCRRVELARRFHNDAVGAARELRRRWVVRWFHLAGRTPWPETVELADTAPAGLSGRWPDRG